MEQTYNFSFGIETALLPFVLICGQPFFVEPFVPSWERTSGWYRWQKVPVDLSKSANGRSPQDLARTWREQVKGRRYFLQLKQNRRSALAISCEMAAYVVIKPTFERTIRRFETQFGETSPPKLWQDIIVLLKRPLYGFGFIYTDFLATLAYKTNGREELPPVDLILCQA